MYKVYKLIFDCRQLPTYLNLKFILCIFSFIVLKKLSVKYRLVPVLTETLYSKMFETTETYKINYISMYKTPITV